MKLFIIDKNSRKKTYLRVTAPNRRELTKALRTATFVVGKNTYTVNEVTAEPSADSAAVGGLLGGVIGAAGGAPGVIIGGLLGAAIGQNQTQKEVKDAAVFNGSIV